MYTCTYVFTLLAYLFHRDGKSAGAAGESFVCHSVRVCVCVCVCVRACMCVCAIQPFFNTIKC